ncbi:MAG: iron ABC transporter permease [Candidatus Methanomethylophilaceae archaeon]|nr:iron ABC transporter permease [Candidatus Methanomethylophilaceae archaeon]
MTDSTSLVNKYLTEWMKKDDTEDFSDIEKSYGHYVWRKWAFMVGCIIVAVVVIGLSLTIGTYKISFLETYQVIWDHITGNIQDVTKDDVIFNLRMPRILAGILAGAGLAVAGACMQSTLKNPLADPFTTGVSSGASLGATIAIILGISIGGMGVVSNAFIFALIPTAMMVAISRMKSASPTMMIMAGIAIMYLFGAITTVLKMWSDPEDLKSLYMWEVGSLGLATWEGVAVMTPVVILGVIAIQLLSRQLNVMATGDDNAKALGVDANKMRTICMVAVAFIAATIVSFTGMIGFVGLVCPHVVRIVIGADNRHLVPASAVFGIALLLTADLIGRTILAPTIIQVGVITAFLGGPMFLWLLLRNKSKVWG